jgi:hypothetical protein
MMPEIAETLRFFKMCTRQSFYTGQKLLGTIVKWAKFKIKLLQTYGGEDNERMAFPHMYGAPLDNQLSLERKLSVSEA